jgi:hypothetical protein
VTLLEDEPFLVVFQVAVSRDFESRDGDFQRDGCPLLGDNDTDPA